MVKYRTSQPSKFPAEEAISKVRPKECAFLFGAGASVDAGIPDTYGLTEKVYRKLNESHLGLSPLLATIIAGIKYQKAPLGEDPFANLNIEEVVSAVKLIAERDTLEIYPFVGSWHPSILKLDRRDSLTRREISQAIDRYSDAIANAIKEVCSEILSQVKQNANRLSGLSTRPYLPNVSATLEFTQEQIVEAIMNGLRAKADPSDGVFKDLYQAIHTIMGDLLWISDRGAVDFLSPLIQLGKTRNVPIFTLNYDNAVELAAESLGINVYDGFVASEKPIETEDNEAKRKFSGFWEPRDPGITLLKMHGSITWTEEQSRIVAYGKKQERNVFFPFTPLLVLGQREKLRHNGPFLELLFEMKERLKSIRQLCVVGYSFRDEHINRFLSEWHSRDKNELIIFNGPDFRSCEFVSQLNDKELRCINTMSSFKDLLKLIAALPSH